MGGYAGMGLGRSLAQDDDSLAIIDTNVSLFHYPFRRLPLDEPDKLVARLQELGVTEAWAGSFEAILHRDVSSVNRRLMETCSRYEILKPIGAINPTLPGWERDLADCQNHRMTGIRLLPNYHGYSLEDPRFRKLLEQATGAGMFVQIAVSLEDLRTQHEKLSVPDVDLSPMKEALARVKGARVQILNHRGRGKALTELAKINGVAFDTARLDGTNGIPGFLHKVFPKGLMHGSHAPFLIAEAALIRTHESGQMEPGELRKVLSGNARRWRKGGA